MSRLLPKTPLREEAAQPSATPRPLELPLSHADERKLWLGLTFKDLSLAALAVDDSRPAAVIAMQGQEKHLQAVNDATI